MSRSLRAAKMLLGIWTVALALCQLVNSLAYDSAEVQWNLNTNQNAASVMDYSGTWENHTFYASPKSWRFPFYSLFLDRFANGDPTNDNANGTAWEQDPTSSILRHGGDVVGLQNSLDYLAGMGIKGIYLAGSPFINVPWAADAYSPLDHSLLDKHFGTIEQYRNLVTAIHERGMYVILENTMSTMGDLLGFDGYANQSTPFDFKGHDLFWKTDRRYHDFHFDDTYVDHCQYPRFWDQLGNQYNDGNTSQMIGCRAGDFDQYGEVSAFGEYPEWQKELSKFAFVQDRLSEWKPNVLNRLIHMSCMQIAMLDIDGFRIDKGLQVTVDPQSNFSLAMRECARNYGKENFFIPGEIVNGNLNAAIYVGRGKEPGMKVSDLSQAIDPLNRNNQSLFIRNDNYSALDAAAFHYTTYRGLQRFLGLSGKLSATGEAPINFVEQWQEVQATNDFINANTGEYDPRHMYGVSNQDVFRWPGLTLGTERQLLGAFITTLEMPGIPMVSWGEEQAFYALDNTASNYVFGRQAMTATRAWQMHGCYYVGDINIYEMPFNSSLHACQDESMSLDHRDPSAPLYNVYKNMFELRARYPTLNDGWTLNQMSNQTTEIYLPGSGNVPTEFGLYSVTRSPARNAQNFDGVGQGNQSIWLVYSNQNTSTTYQFNCSSTLPGLESTALISPFNSNTTVKNLLYPYDEYTLQSSTYKLGEYLIGSDTPNGCLQSLNMSAYGFKALVPKSAWLEPSPRITKFLPGHDFRYLSVSEVQIQLHFSAEMSCDQISKNLFFDSRTSSNVTAQLDKSSVNCETVKPVDISNLESVVPTTWLFSANVTNVTDGIHSLTVKNASSADGKSFTNSNDTFLFRVGSFGNPMVFPSVSNYSTTLLTRNNGKLYLNHNAAGADLYKYTFDWGSTWSDWLPYTGQQTEALQNNTWSGTERQEWDGTHVKVQYWSQKSGSSSQVQEGDLAEDAPNKFPRRWPHLFVHGEFNQYGFDAGIFNVFAQDVAGYWNFNFMTEWPTQWQANVWGINPDGMPDETRAYGDVDGDQVLDRLPPITLQENVANITNAPPSKYLAWWIHINDADLRYYYIPIGSAGQQLALYILLLIIPAVGGILAVYLYKRSFYQVKHNRWGVLDKGTFIPILVKSKVFGLLAKIGIGRKGHDVGLDVEYGRAADEMAGLSISSSRTATHKSRRILIATMEYDIPDWEVKIKIGGLGVMSHLMGKHLTEHELIWIVPCVDGIDYPMDTIMHPITVTVFGKPSVVHVQCHQLNNITYVLLDAPIFRGQTKAEPYPARMDDLESATYYSTWNQCIAECIRRYDPTIYHINDYHGAIAPLYLLPRTIPCALSLHNAEFQGLWPLRTRKEMKEICGVFNLPQTTVEDYVQFGTVFNLLHSGANILRLHQNGFGAVGVSTKYGKRALARYPIFWGLKKIGGLPNPDPTDLAALTPATLEYNIPVDQAYEKSRLEPRIEAQRWAGLDERADAELFVFVGRWSMQKGIDLIADVFPALLEDNSKIQLICIGPVIDLYGKFAALKLAKMMDKYPGRVFSKPEFTMLPPCIFSGAEFALIPSRDEPFGLVAVEFGRKGALGVGSRVGGLGQMPGWWYTVESSTTRNLVTQFKQCIKSALACKPKVRAQMRAISAKQRFPVAQWKYDLNELQETSIAMHDKVLYRAAHSVGHFLRSARSSVANSGATTPSKSTPNNATPHNFTPGNHSRAGSFSAPRDHVLPEIETDADMGLAIGPGHFREHFDDDAISQAPSENNTRPPSLLSPEDYAGELGAPRPLTLNDILSSQDDLSLSKVEPGFTDPTGLYFDKFGSQLDKLSGANSDTTLCVEKFLINSEKEWFRRFYDAKMGVRVSSVPVSGATTPYMANTRPGSIDEDYTGKEEHYSLTQFALPENYQNPKGIRKLMKVKVFDWPIYAFLLALGQIIGANSYQIILLTGQIGTTAQKVYIIAGVYCAASIMWWVMFRRLQSRYVLSLPWVFYGLAFFFIGLGPWIPMQSRGGLQLGAACLYSAASASGGLFFSLNFGSEGSATVKTWGYRACYIQGIQQLYIVGLWFWGSRTNAATVEGFSWTNTAFFNGAGITTVTIFVAVLLWLIGTVLHLGLPDYYRQVPESVPSFYRSLLGRKVVLWFFYAVCVQNLFLSAQTGRNWAYLWTSAHAPQWAIFLLVLVFFVGIWAVAMRAFSNISETHSWTLPIFAVGVGAPRWAQILWATSGMGTWVPWAGGNFVASAIVGRILWLWLGVLDSVQGVGFGMILLQTLTRIHMAFTLIAAQAMGAIFTIIARRFVAPDGGPGLVFPNFLIGRWSTGNALGDWGWGYGLNSAWFWFGLLSQLSICVGFLFFFRKEQLQKP